MHVLDFSIELQNTEVSVTLLKRIPPQTLLQLLWKISEQAKETLVVESVLSIVIGGWIGQLKSLKRNATKDVF